MTLDQERARFLATLEEARQTQEAWEAAATAWDSTLQATRGLNKTITEAIQTIERVGTDALHVHE